MSLDDEVAALEAQGGVPCLVAKLGDTDPELAAEVEGSLAKGRQFSAIEAALRKHHGVDISSGTLSRHKRRLCKCH